MSAWLAYLVTAVALGAALELGFRLSRLKRLERTSDQQHQIAGVGTALLGMLAFVLAFSFSIVEGRFAARKMIVTREANAIGTTYLRTDFLPPAPAARAKELLRQYVDLRVDVHLQNLPHALVEAEKIHQELWRLVAQTAGEKEHSIPFGLYIASLNEVIDLHQERLSIAVRAHLPLAFLFLLYGAAGLTLIVFGFNTGQTHSRNLIATLPLIAVLAALLALVGDMNRPDLRTVKVGQGAMLALQRSMRGEPPEAP